MVYRNENTILSNSFPNKQIQEWGLNIVRGIRRYREFYSWNFVDIEQSLRSNQDGLLTGIKNITPPIRLSLYPYTSIYYENYDEANQFYLMGFRFKIWN